VQGNLVLAVAASMEPACCPPAFWPAPRLRRRSCATQADLSRKHQAFGAGADSQAAAKQQAADLAFVQDYIQRVFCTSLSDSPDQHDQASRASAGLALSCEGLCGLSSRV
jgi:hypothetical protein